MNSEFEFWIIRGDKPVLWTVPFRVTWQDRVATCVPAIHLMVSHASAVSARMGQIGQREGAGWVVKRLAMEKHAQRMTDGENPEEHFSWERQRFVTPHPFSPPDEAVRVLFLNYVYQKGFLHPFCKRRSEVDYVYHQLCKAMLDWLINEEQPVDLCFARMHNSPWRSDAKEAFKRRLNDYGFKSRQKPDAHTLEHNARLRRWFLSGAMFRMLDTEILGRTLEIEPSRTWTNLIKRVERTRFAMLKDQAYADEFTASAARQWPRMATLLAAWLGSTLHSPAIVLEGRPAGSHRFVPVLLIKRGRPAVRRALLSAVLARNTLPGETRTNHKKKPIYPKTRYVRKVPLVQREPANMRNCGPDVLQPNGAPAKGPGVLVPDGHKGSPAV